MKVKWMCVYCGDVVTSDSVEHHKMDFCKCGKSGYDLEEYMARGCGSVKILEEDGEDVSD